MSEDFLYYALPDIGDEEVSAVTEALRSNWLTTGPKTLEFERAFEFFLGGGVQAISVNSATAGLHLAVEALGLGDGDEVITTTHTFTATAEVVRYVGAKPIFVDVDPDTLCIDPREIARAVTSRTKAIIPVHFGGLSASMDEVLAIAREHNLRVVEDAAHALPTTFGGRLIGSLESDASVFSFYANKTMTTGEGGMLVTRDPDLAQRAKVMRLHGINRDAFDRFTSRKPSWYYEVVAAGFKYNLTDIASALGYQQLKKVRRFSARRSFIASIYNRELSGLPIQLPEEARPGDEHAWHLYVIRLKNEATVSRDRFITMMHELGIGCSVHYIPLHLQPYWRNQYGLSPGQFPNSTRAYETSVSLPIYSKMSDEDILRVVRAVRAVLQ
jgi:dTDP-4-amino-4,6-dideoxygalactose transaminase